MANETKYSVPRVMTVKEMSEYLSVHPSTIYKLLRRGDLPGFRIGTDWRFNAEVIDRWCLERNIKDSWRRQLQPELMRMIVASRAPRRPVNAQEYGDLGREQSILKRALSERHSR